MYFRSINEKEIQKIILESFKKKQNSRKTKFNIGILSKSACSNLRNQNISEDKIDELIKMKNDKNFKFKLGNDLEAIGEENNISKEELSRAKTIPNDDFFPCDFKQEKDEASLLNEISDNKGKMSPNSTKLGLNINEDFLTKGIKIERSAINLSSLQFYKC